MTARRTARWGLRLRAAQPQQIQTLSAARCRACQTGCGAFEAAGKQESNSFLATKSQKWGRCNIVCVLPGWALPMVVEQGPRCHSCDAILKVCVRILWCEGYFTADAVVNNAAPHSVKRTATHCALTRELRSCNIAHFCLSAASNVSSKRALICRALNVTNPTPR